MKIEMARAKKRLAYLWLIFASSFFLLLIFITATGKFSANTQELWGWYLQNVMPVLSLIIGVVVIEASNKVKEKVIERFYYRLCVFLSATYFLLLTLTIFLIPIAQKHGGYTPIDFVIFSNIYLGPFQGLVTAGLGMFFVKIEDLN